MVGHAAPTCRGLVYRNDGRLTMRQFTACPCCPARVTLPSVADLDWSMRQIGAALVAWDHRAQRAAR